MFNSKKFLTNYKLMAWTMGWISFAAFLMSADLFTAFVMGTSAVSFVVCYRHAVVQLSEL